MNETILLEHEDKIVTRMGKAFLSERVVYRGKDLHHQLKDTSWIELFAFGITGKNYTVEEIKLLNFIWVSTSYPDKSIWPNHITALAASTRSTPTLALSIGMSACEASIYGGKPFKMGIDFFMRAAKAIEEKGSLRNFVELELANNKKIFGYGRPIATTDERIPHVINFAKEHGLGNGKHLQLALDLALMMKELKGVEMNVAAIYCALGADLGFNSDEFHLFMTPCFFAGMPPCFVEASENPPGSFLPIRCDRIAYDGVSKRQW